MDVRVTDVSAGRTVQTGLLAGSAVVPGTFARSLTPRSWIDQGVITGFATGLTYLLTVVTHDGVELVAERIASKLPMGAHATTADRQRVAVLCTNLAVIPAGAAVQRILVRRPGERTVRGLVRQAAWRSMMTGIAGAALATAQAATSALDSRLRAGGRLTQFPVAVPTGLGIALALEYQRQRGQSEEPAAGSDEGDAPSAAMVRSLAAAGGLVVVGSAVAYGQRRLIDLTGAALAEVLPGSPRLWHLAADTATLGSLATGVAVLYQRVIHKLEAGTTAIDPILTEIPRNELIGPTISGSAASLVPWESLGREGRRHSFAGVRPEPVQNRPPGVPDLSIPTVMGEPAQAIPIQVYVGLDSAPTMQERVNLALAEMDRTGAWDRSLIMLVSPTGTGYVNYCAVAAVQYLSRGDVATVTLQYSKRPSPLSLGKIKGAREQNRLLWLQILKRVRALPVDRRPRIVLFGESLGAHTSQDVLMHWGTLGPQVLGIDRALWIGTPYASRWMQQVTSEQRADVDPDLVAVVNDFGQIEAMPEAQRKALKYVLLSHDNDGVTKFGADLIASRPRWLDGDPQGISQVPGASPRGIPSSMRWRPVVTFVQLLVDMKNAQIPGAYRPWAHDYRPDLARFIREVFDLPCSDEQLARIERAIEERETVRERLFSDSPPGEDVPEPVERPVQGGGGEQALRPVP
jgi:uncharacterized membrane protein